MGTGDTLMVLLDVPQNAILGTVSRYVNDQWVDQWRTGMNVGRMAVDRAGRRCYFTGASDTIYVFSTDGRFLTSWKTGLLNGLPGEMTVGVDGTLCVADLFTIRHFSGDGVPVGAWAVGNIGGIWGLAVDAEGESMSPPTAPSRSCGSCSRKTARGRGVGAAVGLPSYEVSKLSLDFGSVPAGQSRDLTFDISNSGGGTLSGAVSENSPDLPVAGAVTACELQPADDGRKESGSARTSPRPSLWGVETDALSLQIAITRVYRDKISPLYIRQPTMNVRLVCE